MINTLLTLATDHSHFAFDMHMGGYGPMGHFSGRMMIFAMIIFAIVFIIKFLFAVLLYRDSLNRGVDNPKIWFFVTLFSSILALAFYFILVLYRPLPTNTIDQKGSSTVENNTVCSNCKSIVDGKYCTHCGTMVAN